METLMRHITLNLKLENERQKNNDVLADSDEEDKEVDSTMKSTTNTFPLNELGELCTSRALNCESPTKGYEITLSGKYLEKLKVLDSTEDAIRAVD